MPRQHSRRRRRGLGGPLYRLLTTVTAIACISAALTMFFRVRNLSVTGLNRYTEEQIRTAAGVEYGDNLFFLDKYAMKDDILRQLPYIESLRINRGYPDTLKIAVVECGHPMAVIQDGATWLISSTGKIVDQIAENPEGGADGEAADPAEGVAAGGPEEGAADETAGASGTAGEPGESGETGDGTGNAVPESWGIITGCRLLAPAVGSRIALADEDISRQESLLNLLAALESTGIIDGIEAIHMEDEDVLLLEYEDRFTIKLLYDADFLWKLRTLSAYIGSDRIQDNMTGTFDMTNDDKNFFQQDT